jgi:hypothetical protein
MFLVFVLVFLDISVKRLLKQPLHNHTHLFIKAHTKSGAFLTYKLGGGAEYAPTHVAFVQFFPSFISNTSIVSISFRANLDAQNAGNCIYGV